MLVEVERVEQRTPAKAGGVAHRKRGTVGGSRSVEPQVMLREARVRSPVKGAYGGSGCESRHDSNKAPLHSRKQGPKAPGGRGVRLLRSSSTREKASGG